MPPLPTISAADVQQLIPIATEIAEAGDGGQKVVFRARIDGALYAVKFSAVGTTTDDPQDIEASDVLARAKREVETMRECQSPYMVKIGPIDLQLVTVGKQRVLMFTEEFIEGKNLREILRDQGPISPKEAVQLGIEIGFAIKELWDRGKVHRDIKPANIMRRDSNGQFVLLDAGLAFDVQGESLSIGPVGTPKYFSPEQFQFNDRRTMLDFRSDLFSLGVTIYEMVTGHHPFFSTGDTSQLLYQRITKASALAPSALRPELTPEFDEIIQRLLGKSPHLRPRKCDALIDALKGL